MGRHSSFPDLLDECHTIDIGKLGRWGYLKPNQVKGGTLTWSRNGHRTGCIDIWVSTYPGECNLTLSYRYQEKLVAYRVQMTSVPSNLQRGQVWYFLCPVTGKRCRKLYRIGSKFLHREAFDGLLYESQTYSHKNRALLKLYGKMFGSEKAYDQIYSKHFKTHYAGKPTKRYQKLLRQIEES